MYINDYDYLYSDPDDIDEWKWFLQKGEWIRKIDNLKEIEELISKKKEVKVQWVITHSGLEYDTIQLEVKIPIQDGSILYGACGNPRGYEGDPFTLPLDLGIHEAKEGNDSWLPFGIEVAPIIGR